MGGDVLILMHKSLRSHHTRITADCGEQIFVEER